MTYHCDPSPFPLAVLAEASRIAPGRRTSSDGICGDAAHLATGGDHVADSRGIPHAVDISQSMPGAPFWLPTYQQFDAHAYARRKAADWIAGNPDERIKYMVIGQPDGPDIIFDPAVSLTWRQNGAYKTDHRSHLHVSFTVAAERSTAPFFGVEDDVTPEQLQAAVAAAVKAEGLTPDAVRVIVRQELDRILGGGSTQPPQTTIVGVVDHYHDDIIAAIAKLPH